MTRAAVLLCAGGGTRLRPLTDDRPKALVEVGGETILGRAVRLLVRAGVDHLVIATGYRAEAVRSALDRFGARVTFCHNADFECTQNSISLYRCAGALEGQAFFKLDGDLLFHPDVIARLEADPGPLSVAVDKSGTLGEEEMKVMARGIDIERFGKKLDPAKCSGESIGIEKVGRQAGESLFRALARAERAGRRDLYYEDVYSELIAEGLSARAVDVSDLAWAEIDTIEDLEEARRAVTAGRLDLRNV
jgi:choline kinase